MENSSLKLIDLGEDKILQDLILPIFKSTRKIFVENGDDCAAFFPLGTGETIVSTIDPCPTPVINLISENDYYYYGWFTLIINVSDLAAMGATPIGLMVSTVMPEDMLVRDYMRFLQGLSEASTKYQCPIVGGNIKDGKEFSATGSAFGSVHPKNIVTRQGAKEGDFIGVIGDMGHFGSATIAKLKEISIPSEFQIIENALRNPAPKIFEGIELAKQNTLNCCMDSSDGVSACLMTLANVNKLDFNIDLKKFNPHEAVKWLCDIVNLEFEKVMLSWGNWELVVTLSSDKLDQASKILSQFNTPFTIIGTVSKGSGRVTATKDGKKGLLTDFGSYRFNKNSFFSHGIEQYFDSMFNLPLFEENH